MTWTEVLPVGVAVLESGAGLVYLWAGEWKLGVMWAAYGVAAWVLVTLR